MTRVEAVSAIHDEERHTVEKVLYQMFSYLESIQITPCIFSIACENHVFIETQAVEDKR